VLADAPRDEHGAANSGPLTEEEAEDLAKQYIDDAVETVAEMQLTASQLRVRFAPRTQPTLPVNPRGCVRPPQSRLFHVRASKAVMSEFVKLHLIWACRYRVSLLA